MTNYTIFHCHTDGSNGTTIADSITSYEEYVEMAKQCGMKAIGFSEHGNIFEWTKKKACVEKHGLKYIHGVEAYVTESLDERVRDNYHIVLIARNTAGMHEINKLMSHDIANNKDDGHFYYNPRITLDELINTSNNVVITTACLGGLLNKGNENVRYKFIQFAMENKERVFLEIQHHNVKDQIRYNKQLYKLSELIGLQLIAGTDTHSLDEEQAKGREILQISKNVYFEGEDGWDLKFKTYDELVKAYEEQNSLPKNVYMKAIHNTNVLADMVEEYEVDTSHKYPELFDNPEEVFSKRLAEEIKNRNIDVTEPKIKERITREIKGMQETDTINYMLLEDVVKSWCRDKGIPYGYGRGSAAGSYIGYILDIHQIDSLKHDLVFERFINPERVSLAD